MPNHVPAHLAKAREHYQECLEAPCGSIFKLIHSPAARHVSCQSNYYTEFWVNSLAFCYSFIIYMPK